LPIFRKDMLAILQVEQRPHLRISTEYHVTTTAAIATIRPALIYKFFLMEMPAACASVARA
jgi:hypothetical protein